jgi:hypothetical protein
MMLLKKINFSKITNHYLGKISRQEDDISLNDGDEEMLQALLQKDIESINQQSFKMK